METFLYTRLRHGVADCTTTYPLEPKTVPPLNQVLQATTASHLVSTLYHSLYTEARCPSCASRAKWATVLNYDITDKQWSYCCVQTEHVSSSSRLRTVHFKFLRRSYYTPDKLYHLGLRTSDNCDRCGAEAANFLHLA